MKIRDWLARHRRSPESQSPGPRVPLFESLEPRLLLSTFFVEADAVWMAWNSRRLGWLLKPALTGDGEAQDRLGWLLSLLLDWREGEPLRPADAQKPRG